jgi:predicted RNA-binding protein YlqC (UPF0109 family)
MKEISERLRELFEDVVRELVDDFEAAEVTATSNGGNALVLTITTAPGEVGKVIGKKGKTIEALRHLLEAMAARNRIRVVLEVDDRKGGSHA